MFTAAFFTITKIWKQPKCPWIDEWIKKMWYISTMEYYSAIKNEILPCATAWMDLEGIKLNEISQTEEDKHCIISYVESKKTKQIKQNDNRVIEAEKNWVVAREEGGVG